MSQARNQRRVAKRRLASPENVVDHLPSGKFQARMYFSSVKQWLTGDECDTRELAIASVQSKAAQAASAIESLLNGGPH